MDQELMTLIGLMVVATVMILYSLWPSRKDNEETVRRRSAGLTMDEDPNVLRARAKEKAKGQTVLDKAAPTLSRLIMPTNAEEQSNIRGRLACAGFRRESAVSLFLASKTLSAALCGIAAAFYAIHENKETINVIGYSFVGCALGFMLPNLWLGMACKKRMEAVTNGLPDSLDLMVVAVEAGLGLDAALQRVGDEMRNAHPALAEEMQIATVETQMGVPRTEALHKMACRTDVQEMKALVAVISQAEKLGTSVATALRTQSEALRTKRRQRAEERAQKTAVKLLLPLILFIFPSIFVVLAGPAAVQLMRTFGN